MVLEGLPENYGIGKLIQSVGRPVHSVLVTVVDRKSRLLLAQSVSKVSSNCVKQALIDLLQTITPSRVRTITPDEVFYG